LKKNKKCKALKTKQLKNSDFWIAIPSCYKNFFCPLDRKNLLRKFHFRRKCPLKKSPNR